ncbi:hypothetical protein EHW97_08255 [Aeromicrobium camelliae]|uniref:DUF8094 domain-containing protein n=1 Tax=Aeromicrobium camelliae TaxID=1538144 RepID=A0A3N6ZCU8_9ACTN|nr:hypothetical protein [Aeromicrobium camelliae]RQN08011.1 hypothetical protein EHW97_08255 [Aeromicrobium camelliae]
MRRLPMLAGALAAALALSACAVPRERAAEDLRPAKLAVAPSEVDDVVAKYREVRSAAVDALDAKPLSTVETGPVLAVDTGMFEVAELLEREEFALDGPFTVESTMLPRFDSYPLWFVALVRDEETGRRQLQVYERTTAADPWLLTATPELAGDTPLPEMRRVGDATRRVGPDDGEGMVTAPRSALQGLASALDEPEAEEAAAWAEDPFVVQMRETATQNADLEGSDFAQSWAADEQIYALRTADGGALVFGTLLRQDTFDVDAGLRVTWPEESPQRAFWPDGVVGRGSLRYYHQVLVRVPPAGSDEPAATLGTFGGVVGSAGQ